MQGMQSAVLIVPSAVMWLCATSLVVLLIAMCSKKKKELPKPVKKAAPESPQPISPEQDSKKDSKKEETIQEAETEPTQAETEATQGVTEKSSGVTSKMLKEEKSLNLMSKNEPSEISKTEGKAASNDQSNRSEMIQEAKSLNLMSVKGDNEKSSKYIQAYCK